MDLSKPASMTALVRTIIEESEKRERRLSRLHEAIAARTYAVSSAALGEAVMQWMRSV